MNASPFDIIRDTLETIHEAEKQRVLSARDTVIAGWSGAPHLRLRSIPPFHRDNDMVRALVTALEQAGLLTVAAEHWSEETLRKLQEDGE